MFGPETRAHLVVLRFARVHPLMLLPSVVLLTVMFAVTVVVAALAIPAALAASVAWPTLRGLHRMFVAVATYQPSKAVTP